MKKQMKLLKNVLKYFLIDRDQTGLQTLTRRSDFIFDCVHLLYYKCHKINIKRGVSYIDSPDWTKYNKGKINLINKKIINTFK